MLLKICDNVYYKFFEFFEFFELINYNLMQLDSFVLYTFQLIRL